MSKITDARRHTVHMIGNSHIDPVWRWRWQEGYATVHSTFKAIVERLRETDDFIFVRGGAQGHAWIEEADPALFREIRRFVRQGRWIIVNGWWEQPDCNMPSGESFARHALYGQRYFKEKFGVIATVGYNVDSFGHNAGLPQLLLQSGMKYYVFMRPGPGEIERELPAEVFWWEGADGSLVLTARIPLNYAFEGDVEGFRDHIRKCRDAVPARLGHSMAFYGVGNHGGGPTKRAIAAIRQLDADPNEPRVIFSHPQRFFEAIRTKSAALPLVKGEFQYHSAGCFTSQSEIKRLNRRAEYALIAAEKYATMAHALTGQPVRRGEFERGWRRVLFNQHHDTLPGTSLMEAYEDARAELHEAIAIAEREQNAAIHAVARDVDTTGDGPPVLVFNPHATTVRAPIEVQFNFMPRGQLVDADGRPVPFQFIRATTLLKDGRIVFEAEVPPLGYQCYTFDWQTPRPEIAGATADGNVLENRHWRLEIDPKTGDIARLYDRDARREVFRGAANQAIVVEDKFDTWGHAMRGFDATLGAFDKAKVSVLERGPVRATLRVERRYGRSTLRQDVSLCHEARQIDVRCFVDWHEQFESLKLAFPVDVTEPRATFEQAYAVVQRPGDGHETVMQRWVDVTGFDEAAGEALGLAILNNGKYGCDVRGATIRITALRGCPYCWHHPHQPEKGERYYFMDQGPQEFVLSLLPHTGGWQAAGVPLAAAVLNEPLVYEFQYPKAGRRPKRAEGLRVEPPGVALAALKLAEDSDALIARLYEATGKATKATLSFGGWRFTRSLRAGEVQTLKIDLKRRKVQRTNLIESQELSIAAGRKWGRK